jgi:protein TonB
MTGEGRMGIGRGLMAVSLTAGQGRENGVTEGDIDGSPIALPAGLLVEDIEPANRRERTPWLAMLAAALLHALIALWLVVDWSRPALLPKEPNVIPVQVVLAPPAPPPPPAPAPTSKPAPPSLAYRQSGPDQRTTAPPPADKAAAEDTAPPPPAPKVNEAEKETAPPPPQEKPPPPEQQPAPQDTAKSLPNKQVARLEPPRKEAERLQAMRVAPQRHLNVEPGERSETGDPYLNQLQALIERHRIYPRVIGPFGLPSEGTAVYDVAVDRSGRILGMRLDHSSGIAGIDQAVESMIRSSLPFPPLPPDYPNAVNIEVAIRLFPPS